MTKKDFCKSRKSIEYGINDFIYCISNCWHGGEKEKKYHKCKIYYARDNAYFFVNKYKILLSDCISMEG